MADFPAGLAALFRLPTERAVAFLAAKGLKLSGPYWELDGPEHSRNFTVANLAKLDVLADIKAAVQGAMDQGQTETWFRKQLVDTLKAKGWWGPTVAVDPVTGEARMMQQGSLRRLQTIYRTNLQSAYMAGRHAQALEQTDRAPFAQYLSVRDSRSRPAHAALDGKVFRLDSPEWSIISPPNGYNCRCRARYMSQREIDKRGLQVEGDARLLERTPEKVPTDPLTGESPDRIIERGVSVPSRTRPGERDVLWADRGWDHLPGSSGVERAMIDRMMTRADEFGGAGPGLRQIILSDLAARSVAYVRAAGQAGASKQSAYVLAPSLSSIASRAESAGITKTDLRRAALVLDHDRVRKILIRHGKNATEGSRGQRAVTPEDFARIPEVLSAAGPAAVTPGSPALTNSGQRIQIEAELDGEHWTVVLEIRNKQHTAAVQALWIRPQRA